MQSEVILAIFKDGELEDQYILYEYAEWTQA